MIGSLSRRFRFLGGHSPPYPMIAILLATVLMASMAQASPLRIVDHSDRMALAHDASGYGGISGGSKLGYFLVDGSSGNFYDPDTGALQLRFLVFSDLARTAQIGSATGTSTDLLGAGFDGDNSLEIIGSIVWDIALDSGSAFHAYMQSSFGGSGDWSVTTRFADAAYVTGTNQPNSLSLIPGEEALYLIGADGSPDWGLYTGSKFGVDLALGLTHVHTPEPASLLLLGSGLAGLVGYRRRQQAAVRRAESDAATSTETERS